MGTLFRLPIRRARRDLEEEFAFHLEMRAAELIARGWKAEAAREEARRQFGDLDDARAYCHATDHQMGKRQMRAEFLHELRQDLRFALRALRRTPAFTLAAVLTIALGTGATTAIFSVVRGVLLRPLPFAEPGRLVTVAGSYKGFPHGYTSPANADDWIRQNRSFASMSVMTGQSAVLTGAGEPELLTGEQVSAGFFGLLGVRPVAGRLQFSAAEAAWQGPKAVIVSETLWRTRFGADPGLVGRLITLDGERVPVVGIAPAAAAWPAGTMLWFPFTFDPARLASARGAVYLEVIARLRPGVSVAAGGREMADIAARQAKDYPDMNKDVGAVVIPLREWVTGKLDRPLYILLGSVAFVLLIACANVANLLLVRGSARASELAVRAALGAGRGRLVRQLVTESLALALTGAIAGVGLAALATRSLVRAAPASIPRLGDVRVDGLVLGVALGVALLTGLFFGVVPARLILRPGLAGTLRQGGRSGSQGVEGHRTRRALVVAEVALSVMLLAGSGLLIRSFARLTRVDPGVRTSQTLSFDLSLPEARYPDAARKSAFTAALLERLRAVPGVRSASAVYGLPLVPFSFGFSFSVAGRAAPPGDEPMAQVRVGSAGFEATMGIPLRKGRGFTAADREGAPGVFLINEAAAKEFFPGQDPIGKHLRLGWGGGDGTPEGDIVGVVGDVKQASLSRPARSQIWVPFDQRPVESFSVVLHGPREPQALLADARRIVHELDGDLAVTKARTFDEMLQTSVAEPRFYMVLLAGFAGVAIVLAGIGVYGVIAYLVGQRSREIGIRIALGASQARVVRLVLREGVGMAVIGIALGIGGALALSKLLASLLFEVRPNDPASYAAAALTFGAVALSACALPALRAARVDPVEAIAYE